MTDKTYCTECPYFKYTNEDSDYWYGTKCEKDNHEAQPSMYAIKSLHDRCPLTERSVVFNEELGKADFTLDKNEDFETIFHFFARDSRCHSFNDDPPKNWNEVYKVYYSWSITQNMLGMDDEVVESEVLIDVVWDECSRLTNLSDCIRDMIYNKKENIYLVPLGQPASEWHIDRIANDTLLFTVWEDPTDVGYRFRLTDEAAEEFAQFLDEVNQYMLEHGVGI